MSSVCTSAGLKVRCPPRVASARARVPDVRLSRRATMDYYADESDPTAVLAP
jgi:hypothetical protein